MTTWFDRNATAFKVLLCIVLLLILMIPTAMLSSTIYERSNRATEARNEIMSKWGANQVLTGPIISVPYITKESQTRYYHFLPNTLSVDAKLVPEERKRGIYSTIVYTSADTIRATYEPLSASIPASFSSRNGLQWNRSVISYGITDMKGIQKSITATLDGKNLAFQPGLITSDVISSGVSREVALNPNTRLDIALEISLKGGEQIAFVPLGKTTEVTVAGPWPSPSFNGAFLPTKRTVEGGNFQATWSVTDFNRNFPQQWEGASYQLQHVPQTVDYRYDSVYLEKSSYTDSMTAPSGYNSVNIGDSVFGVKLIEVVDHYDKSERSIKYAFLIIGLSFLAFFLMEVIRRKPIHVLQYLLVGFALVVFYTLLLSLAEHIGFNPAYIVSALATITLITLYTKAICYEWKYAHIVGGILVVLYALVFVILQSEDYALLIGSVAVFLILGMLMYTTRKIDWYQTKK
ncbi:cell envelope integrity protein CreD [Candidatus Gracilibacteria bacterium]|nr:cell envelope integrity protein CreD [Candidatus Gracilibacteria bacterium]